MAKREKFRYRGDKRSVETVSRKSRQSGGMYDSYLLSEVQMLKLRDGENTIRIMPPSWPEEDDKKWGDGWDIGIWIHFGVGPDNATYLCADKMDHGECPICEARRGADDDERDALKPSWRALAWAIDRNNEKAGPQVWGMPVTVFREINLRSIDKKHNTPIPVDSPDEGFDIMFDRSGTGIKTKYEAFEIERDPTPLHDDERVQDKWLDYIEEHPLPDILQFYESDHIRDVLFGKTSRRDDADEDDGGGRRRTSGSRRRSTDDDARAERDYRSDDPDDGEEGDEEEGRSRRTSSARGGRKPARRRPDPDPDDDRDEEEAALSRRSSSRRVDDAPTDDEIEEPDADDLVEEVDDDPPPRSSRGGGRTRSARLPDPEEPDPDEEEPDPDEEPEDDPKERAKGKLDRLKGERGRTRPSGRRR